MANVSNFSAVTPGASVSGKLTDKEVVAPIAPPDGLRADGPRVTFHFAGAWDAGNTYIYYDVVKDSSGASWICKYPRVPVGTPLEEGTYWTRWAEPNIELEELYQTVQRYDARITANSNDISKIKKLYINANSIATPEMFGAKGDGVTDDLSAIKQAVNSTATHIIFGNGKTYCVSDEAAFYRLKGKHLWLGNAIIKGTKGSKMGGGAMLSFYGAKTRR